MKTQIRNNAKVVRSEFNATCDKDLCVRMVIENLKPLLKRDNSCIAGYHPKGDEFDILPVMNFLQDIDYDTCLPCLSSPRLELNFRRWRLNDRLEKGAFDLYQPANDNKLVTPDILLIPLLAADKRGNRIGYGMGHYDYTIAKLKQIKPLLLIGVCYDIQIIEQAPKEDTDQPLDYIVTERELYKCQI